MKVTDLTVDELHMLIRKAVHEELCDLFTDPDKGLALTEEIQVRLQASLASQERIPFEEVKRRLNLR
jgi:hypothetical protein